MSDESKKPPMTRFSFSEAKPTEMQSTFRDDSAVGEQVGTYVYEYEPSAPAFQFEHHAAKGVFRLTSEGKTEVFRDQPTRYLCLEPDETGAMRPVRRLWSTGWMLGIVLLLPLVVGMDDPFPLRRRETESSYPGPEGHRVGARQELRLLRGRQVRTPGVLASKWCRS